ncbi:hypothetical protein E1B28_002189 [Marasmius oreades]|nr:uncharacterized protein E1B28_002189 [Marasmius oreades]KAG7086224.1 hypothetical protein E1B28_002189 [Marasmius oreades]
MEGLSEKIQPMHDVPGSPTPSPKMPMKTTSEPKLERESPPPPSKVTPKSTMSAQSENFNPRKRKSHPDESGEQSQQQQHSVQITEDDADMEGDVDAEGDEVNDGDGVDVVEKAASGSPSPPSLPRIDFRLPSVSVKIKRCSSPSGGDDVPPGSVSEYESGCIKCHACGTDVPFRNPETGQFNLDPWNKHRLNCASAAGSVSRPKPNHQMHHHSHLQNRSHAPEPHSISVPKDVCHIRHHDHHPSDSHKRLSTSISPPPHGPYQHPGHPHSHSQHPHPHPHQHQHQHQHHARHSFLPLAPSNGGEREPVIYTPESTASALAHPPPKRRRAKRTEEERIHYLKSDPYVAQFEAYRVLCASCDKWIRLRPNSTYCSIPWDAHRKSCLAKKISSKNTYALEERNSLFSKDPDVRKFDAERVLCSECDQWIGINSDDHLQAVQKWLAHKSSCQKVRPRNTQTGSGPPTLSPEAVPQAPPPSHARPSSQHQHSPHLSRSQLPSFPPHPPNGSPSVSHPHPSLTHRPPPASEILFWKETLMRRRALSVSGATPVVVGGGGGGGGVGSSGTVPVPVPQTHNDSSRPFSSPELERQRERRMATYSQSRPQGSLSPSPTPPVGGGSQSQSQSQTRHPSPGEGPGGSCVGVGVNDVKTSSGPGGTSEDNGNGEVRRIGASLSPRVPTVAAFSSAGVSGSGSGSGSLSTAAQESRRRNAEQRAATLRADPLIEEVEPNRVFCSLCQKWVQLRQDSSYCAYPWLQHRGKCLVRYKRRTQKAEEIAEFKRRREAMRIASSSSSRHHHESHHPYRHIVPHGPPSHRDRDYPAGLLTPPPYGDPGTYEDEDVDESGSEGSTPVSTASSDPVVEYYLNKRSDTLRVRRHDSEYHHHHHHHPYFSETGFQSVPPPPPPPPPSAVSSTKQRGGKHVPHVYRGMRIPNEGDVELAEVDPDTMGEGEGERNVNVVDGDGDVEMISGEKSSRRSARRPAMSRRNSGYPYDSRPGPQPPTSPPRRLYGGGGGRSTAQVVVPAISAYVPPQLADLDSPSGRKHFVFSSITYLFQTTYEATDDMSISSLLTYLNAAMPPDKHEDFDTAEVAKAVVASGDRGRYVLEGDLVRRL